MRHEQYMKDRAVQEIIDTAERIGDKLDMVNSPPHYNQTGIECIHAISAATNTASSTTCKAISSSTYGVLTTKINPLRT